MSKPISRATSTWGVLRSVWAVNRRKGGTEGASVEEVLEHVLSHRDEPIDYRTVATHLRNLEARDLLVSTKKGRRLYYRPIVDELVAVSDEVRKFFDNIIHDEPELLDEVERQLLERRYDVEARKRQKQKRRAEAH
jgi:predicted transcriptional regulator